MANVSLYDFPLAKTTTASGLAGRVALVFLSEEANQSKTSLGLKNPEHAVVEVSDKITSLGFKNAERAVVEVSDKITSLGFKKPEQAVGELSDNNEINNMSESIPNQWMDLENEIIYIMQVPFRTDSRGEISTEDDGAIYSKQYPYALSASDFVKLCKNLSLAGQNGKVSKKMSCNTSIQLDDSE